MPVIMVVTAVFVVDVTVVVATMLVMDMAAIMRMIVLAMGMIMMGVTVVIVTAVVMTVAVIMVAMIMVTMGVWRCVRSRIGAAFGIERRLDLDDAGAETFHHFLDDVIAADAQATGGDLGRQVAVAEMPGKAHEMAGIGAADLDQRFRRSHHLDAAAVFQHESVAAAQGDGVFEIKQELQSARPRHCHAAAMAIVEIEDDGVDGRFNPVILADDGSRADHGVTRLV